MAPSDRDSDIETNCGGATVIPPRGLAGLRHTGDLPHHGRPVSVLRRQQRDVGIHRRESWLPCRKSHRPVGGLVRWHPCPSVCRVVVCPVRLGCCAGHATDRTSVLVPGQPGAGGGAGHADWRRHDAPRHSSPPRPMGRGRLVGNPGIRHAMRCGLRRSTTASGPTGPRLIRALPCLDTARCSGGCRFDRSWHATCHGPANDWHRPVRPIADRVRKLVPRGSPEGSFGRCLCARHACLDVVLLSQDCRRIFFHDPLVQYAWRCRLQLVGIHGPRPTVTRLDIRCRAGSQGTRASSSGSRRLDVTPMARTRNRLVGYSCLCKGPGGGTSSR